MNTFHSVKRGKISERIANQIRRFILKGSIKPGDRLPPERELTVRFQASRISVREALKSLETSGLLLIKPGSGVFVAEINSKPMSESLLANLKIQKAAIHDLTEARVILEPNIAKLATMKILPEDLLRLEQNIQEASALVRSNIAGREKNLEFHSLIAQSTHNPAIALLIKTLLDVLKETVLEIKDSSQEYIQIAGQVVDYHKKILRAIREKKPKKVHDLMLKHILQIQGGLQKSKSKK